MGHYLVEPTCKYVFRGGGAYVGSHSAYITLGREQDLSKPGPGNQIFGGLKKVSAP